MSTFLANVQQFLIAHKNSINHIIQANRFNLDINRELHFVAEQVRLSHNKMAERNAENMALSSVTPASLLNCIELGIEMGLSFNPQRDFVHLIPRFNKAVGLEATLMIGYRGYKKIAADAGAFSRIDTQLVYENDVFEFNGVDKPVIHRVTTLSQEKRGALAGGYCMAKLKNPGVDGEYIVTVMSPEELFAIEQQASKNGGFSPWKGAFKSQMYLKSVIRRAWKDWEFIIEDLGLSNAVIQRVGEHHKREEIILNPDVETSSAQETLAG